jgi:hypothetical protein
MKLTGRIRSNRLKDDYPLETREMQEAVSQLKACKNEGICGLSSHFFDKQLF